MGRKAVRGDQIPQATRNDTRAPPSWMRGFKFAFFSFVNDVVATSACSYCLITEIRALNVRYSPDLSEGRSPEAEIGAGTAISAALKSRLYRES